MVIRNAKKEDVKRAIELILLALGEYKYVLSGCKKEGEVVARFEEYFLSEKGRYSYRNFAVADHKDRVVGVINYYNSDDVEELNQHLFECLQENSPETTTFEAEWEPGEFYLDSLAVDPAYRGRGVAKKLIEYAEKVGRQRGMTIMSLIVLERKHKAYWLYRRLGFHMKLFKKLYGEDYKYMSKAIDKNNR